MNTDHLHQKRMRGIETLLLWEGEVGNARVRQLFDVTLVRASQLLASYRQLNPNGIAWDTKRRVYRRVPGFRARLDPHGMQDYDQLLFGHEQPFVLDARPDFTSVDPDLFAPVYQGCVNGTALLIGYRSMSRPEGTERVIVPHSLVRVGRRWHVRAWCASRAGYRDFAMGRVFSATPIVAALPTVPDTDWDTEVELQVVAHRALTPEQQAVIRGEYFGGALARNVRVRRCLAQYMAQDLRAAVQPKRQLPPEYQLEIANAEALHEILFSRSGEDAAL